MLREEQIASSRKLWRRFKRWFNRHDRTLLYVGTVLVVVLSITKDLVSDRIREYEESLSAVRTTGWMTERFDALDEANLNTQQAIAQLLSVQPALTGQNKMPITSSLDQFRTSVTYGHQAGQEQRIEEAIQAILDTDSRLKHEYESEFVKLQRRSSEINAAAIRPPSPHFEESRSKFIELGFDSSVLLEKAKYEAAKDEAMLRRIDRSVRYSLDGLLILLVLFNSLPRLFSVGSEGIGKSSDP